MSITPIQANAPYQPMPRQAPAAATTGAQAPAIARDSLQLVNNAPAPQPSAQARGFLGRLFGTSAPTFNEIVANDPSAVWNMEEVSPLTKAALVAYRRGRIGQSVQGLDLRGKSTANIRGELRRRGFQQETTALRDFKTGKPIINPKTGKPVPMEVWSHSDGGMVRIKPEGDPSSKHRPQPHASVSVKYPPDASGHDFNYEAFKLDANGNPMPKWAKDAKNPYGDSPAGQRFYDDLADQTHVNLQS